MTFFHGGKGLGGALRHNPLSTQELMKTPASIPRPTRVI